jgi:hypothetical protein
MQDDAIVYSLQWNSTSTPYLAVKLIYKTVSSNDRKSLLVTLGFPRSGVQFSLY